MTTFELRTLICLNTTLDQNIVYSEINETFNCKTRNVVYYFFHMRRTPNKPAYRRNFNLPGHELYHLKVSVVLEKVQLKPWENYLKYENLNIVEIFT